MLPVLVETVEIAANRVEVFGPIAFVTSSAGLTSVDLSSGTVLQTLEIGELTDVTRQGAFLYTMATDNEITIVEIAGLTMAERGDLVLPQGSGRLFVGDDVAYATASDFDRGGIVTVDVSDPDAPALISGSDVELPLVAPSTAFAANGTGLALLVGDPLDTSQLTVVDVSDPANTSVADETFRTRINLPTSPHDVAIAGGIAFVANGVNGLQVVNYVEFDSLGIPPTVSLGALDADVDPLSDGIQVFEGRVLPLTLEVTDDVQLRSVELLVDGAVMQNDVSFPFDVAAIAPSLLGGESQTMMVQVRATDTGGNMALSDLIELEVIKDDVAPVIDSFSLTAGDEFELGLVSIELSFSERIEQIDDQNFFVLDSGGEVVSPVNVLVSPDGTTARFTYQLLQTGSYEFTIDAPSVMDLPGNVLSDTPIVTSFSVPGTPTELEAIFPGLILPQVDTTLAMAVGDLNGDTFPDVALGVEPDVFGDPHTLEVYLGNGNGTFKEPISRELSGIPAQLFIEEMTGDQINDLVVRYEFQINISVNREILAVLVGDGTGSFATDELRFGGKSIDTGSSPEHLSVADFSGDGLIDVVTVTSNASVRSFINRGDGTFDTIENAVSGVIPIDSDVGDIDGNGTIDLINVRPAFIDVFLNDGTGTFTKGTTPTVSLTSQNAIALADLNEDDILDLVVGDRNTNTIAFLTGNGDATFAAESLTALAFSADSIRAVDIDNDDHLDLFVTDIGGDTGATVFGDGAGNLTVGTAVTIPNGITNLAQPVLTNVDQDDRIDFVYLQNFGIAQSHVGVLLGLGDGAFSRRETIDVADSNSGGETSNFDAGDLNGDSLIDFVT